jgi:predicted nucleic acid-binding protein
MSRIFFDTNLFVYLFEGTDERAERVASLVERLTARRDQLYTSVMTLGEILVKPIEAGDLASHRILEEALSAHAVLVPFDRAAALVYAHVRQDRGIRPPDAIQLSCASVARVDLFVTNDDRLSRRVIPGIQFIAALDKAFL